MSSVKLSAVRRCPPGLAPSGAQLPVALRRASGTLSSSRLSRHSLTRVGPARLTALISTRPRRRLDSTRSSTAMSSAGTLLGCCRICSTSLAAEGARFSRASRA
ncbi:hypothetical protein FQZ97_933470 [compost metagenome]